MPADIFNLIDQQYRWLLAISATPRRCGTSTSYTASASAQIYIGATSDLKRRIAAHNAGKSPHTSKFTPWELCWYCAFPDKFKALEFERYLKSHSGRAFANKRLCPPLISSSQQASQESAHDH